MTAIANRTEPPQAQKRPSRTTIRRRFLRWLLVVGLILVVALGGVSWYYSDQVRADLLTPKDSAPDYTIGVLDVGGDRVVLERADRTMRKGIQGLEWADGYGQAGDILAENDSAVTRTFRPLEGSLAPGDLVLTSPFAFPGDPERAFGMAFEEVAYDSPLGRFPAWLIDGGRDRWVIHVHGKGAPRAEALRTLPAVAEAGYASLVITYRNDSEVRASPDGRYHFGDTEWLDLEAAVQFAVERGAKDVVLFGYSTGGAITAAYLGRSESAEVVRGVILDAPFLDVEASVDLEGANRGLPQFLTWFAERLSSLRFGIDWDDWDRVDEVAAVDLPILLFHGTADSSVPVDVSDRLAAARPDISYVRVPDAGHVTSWNMAPAQYETAVRTFLAELDTAAAQ